MGRYAQLALLAVLVSYCSSCSGWLFNKKERRFLRWLKNNGAVLADGISIDKVEWGRGVLTSKPLKAKDTLLTLPEHLIISAQAIVSSDRLTEEEIDVFKGLRYDGAIITTFLVREKALGKASFWHPYLDLLPDAIPRPANWSADELELLEDAAIQIDAMSDQQRLQQAHAVSLPALDRLLQALPASLRKRAAPVMHSFETYAWADGIVQSRALTFQGQRRLIPFSDFLNYAPHHQARPYSNGAFFLEHHLLFWQGSAMTATVLVDRDTPAGSQVFEDYGDNPNVIYLLYHGFVPAQRNPFDCVSMELRRPTAHASDNRNLEQLRHQLLNKLRLSSSPTLCVTADAASWANARVWHALAVVSMDEAQVRACRATLDGRSCAGLGSFFSEAERSAVVAAAVERRLSEYSTSLQEDERMLAKRKRASEGGRLSANALTAVAYRRWQKVLLQDITTTLSRSRESSAAALGAADLAGGGIGDFTSVDDAITIAAQLVGAAAAAEALGTEEDAGASRAAAAAAAAAAADVLAAAAGDAAVAAATAAAAAAAASAAPASPVEDTIMPPPPPPPPAVDGSAASDSASSAAAQEAQETAAAAAADAASTAPPDIAVDASSSDAGGDVSDATDGTEQAAGATHGATALGDDLDVSTGAAADGGEAASGGAAAAQEGAGGEEDAGASASAEGGGQGVSVDRGDRLGDPEETKGSGVSPEEENGAAAASGVATEDGNQAQSQPQTEPILHSAASKADEEAFKGEAAGPAAAALAEHPGVVADSIKYDPNKTAFEDSSSDDGQPDADAAPLREAAHGTATAEGGDAETVAQSQTGEDQGSAATVDGLADAPEAAVSEAREAAAAVAAAVPQDDAAVAGGSSAGGGGGEGRSELQARVDAFNAWVQEAVGCGVNKLRVQVIDGYRIGAVATEPIAAEEVYLTVPLSAVMNAATAAAHPVLGPVIASLQEQPQWSDPDALMLQLMHERFVAREASAFWPYLALLPTLEEYSVPLTYSDAEVELLRGSDMHAAVVRYRAEVHAAFDRLYGAGGLAAAPETAFVTRERYLWAEAVTSSRAIWWNHKRNMVPLLDAVNCGQGPPGSRPHATRLDESGRFAVTAAAWAFDAGEQVLENYGQPNHIYLQYHGFVIKDNRMDCVRVLDFSPPPDASRETIMRVRRIFSRTPNACVNPYSVPMEFAGWLRIMAGLPYPPRGGISWGSVLDAAGLQAVVDWAQARIGKYDMAVFQSSAAAQTSNGRVVREFIESEVDLLMGMVARFGKMLEARRAEEAKRLEAEARLQAAHSEGGTPGATGMGAGAVAA